MSPQRFAASAAGFALAAVLFAVAMGQAPSAPATPAPGATRPASPPAGSRPVTRKTEQMRGFSLQMWVTPPDTEPEAVAKYMKAIDDIADMGCTWINLPVSARQENVNSMSIAINWTMIPSKASLQKIMAKAKSRGMGVMMMPMVLLNNSGPKDWRGVIDPPNWDQWFASYTLYITEMARLANAGEVDIFCVGSELLSTEPFTERWT